MRSTVRPRLGEYFFLFAMPTPLQRLNRRRQKEQYYYLIYQYPIESNKLARVNKLLLLFHQKNHIIVKMAILLEKMEIILFICLDMLLEKILYSFEYTFHIEIRIYVVIHFTSEIINWFVLLYENMINRYNNIK